MNDRRKPINTPLGRTLKNNIPITKIPQFKPIEAYHLFSFTCAPSRFALFITFHTTHYCSPWLRANIIMGSRALKGMRKVVQRGEGLVIRHNRYNIIRCRTRAVGGAEKPPRGFGPVEIEETLNAVKCPGWPRQSVRWQRRVRLLCTCCFEGCIAQVQGVYCLGLCVVIVGFLYEKC